MDVGLNMLADIKDQVEYPCDAHDVSHTKSIQKDAGYFLVVAAEEITVLTMGDIECCTFAHMALIKFFSYLPLFFAVIVVGIHNLSLLANIWKHYFHSC